MNVQALGDPWDNISFMEKKRFGLYYYYLRIADNPVYGFHGEALIYAADMVKVSPSTIMTWITEYEGIGEIKTDGRGHSSPMPSPMDNDSFREKLKEFVKVKIRISVTYC